MTEHKQQNILINRVSEWV